MTHELPARKGEQVRVLECWLPLAQEINQTHGWGYDARALERLVLLAIPALQRTHNSLTARAVLWHYYRQQRRLNP